MSELDPTLYRYHLKFKIKGITMIQQEFEQIEPAVRMLNNLATEWNIQTEVVPMYAYGERNEMILELKGVKK
jgi:hypothetical protein